VTGGYLPWTVIDNFIGKIAGTGPSVSMMNGVLGIISASIFSSNTGFTVFGFGLMAILNVLSFILSLIYTYLLSILTIGFMLILMPVMIPLSLFFYTENYLKK